MQQQDLLYRNNLPPCPTEHTVPRNTLSFEQQKICTRIDIFMLLCSMCSLASLSNSRLFFTHNFPKCVALPLHFRAGRFDTASQTLHHITTTIMQSPSTSEKVSVQTMLSFSMPGDRHQQYTWHRRRILHEGNPPGHFRQFTAALCD